MANTVTSDPLQDLREFLDPEPLLILVSGPSGVGKDSVIGRMREMAYPFHFVVTATDRPQRAGEVHGQDYFFMSTEEFERMIAADAFFEHALVYDQYKGVPKDHARQALACGQDVIMRLDVQGVATMQKLIPQALAIFIAPPSMAVLQERLLARKSDPPAQVRQRLQLAMQEMRRMASYDYVVINYHDKLDQAAQQIAAIIAAEKCRIGRRHVRL